ncbi:MAG: tetratricopeptide repeat protein [Candidatus Azobacteroides sp.]|nr:tetratricopeptide repeat protein [Candidatus Azobacteroides sp.]
MIKRTAYLLSIVFITGVLSSCSKKMNPLTSDYFTATPQLLEVVGNKIPVSISGNIPPKYFPKNAKLSITPILRYGYGEIAGDTFVYQGENIQGNDQTISYENGGNIKMSTSFNYKPELASCELYLMVKSTIKGNIIEMPMIKIGEGTIATATLSSAASATPAIAPDAFQRIIKEKRNADIMFLIEQANLRPTELNKSEVQDLQESMQKAASTENQRIAGIEVASYASPDGGPELNEKLASAREKNTVGYLNKEMSKNAVNAPVDAHFTAQDWEGFSELVQKSNIQDKDLILRVLSMYSDPERREQEIKNISATYKKLSDDILPQLRRSRLIATIEIIGKSDEQISSLAASNPKALTIEELLYAATLEKTVDDRAMAYRTAMEIYPDDYRAYNNLGALLFGNGDMKEASQMYAKALQLNPNAPEVNMNAGLMALVNGDAAKAQQYFGKSSGVPELNGAMGVLYTQSGNYTQAVNMFGDTKNNNAAVAQILTKDYNKAKSTLTEIPNPDAMTAYLSAIVGARTNNASMVFDNLKSAIAKDRSMAQKALDDKEFYKFAQSPAFQALVK